MEKHTEIKHTLEWTHPNQGEFKATVTNGKVSELNFCEAGNKVCLISLNEAYLRSLHESLGELIKFIEVEQKNLGYTFAKEDEP
jgi:hypothetical protein